MVKPPTDEAEKHPPVSEKTQVERRIMSFEWTESLGYKNGEWMWKLQWQVRRKSSPPLGLWDIENIWNQIWGLEKIRKQTEMRGYKGGRMSDTTRDIIKKCALQVKVKISKSIYEQEQKK